MSKQKLQLWWIPQVPMKAFNVDVSSVSEAAKLLSVLANYDLFQYENRVKGDYANAGGLNVWDEDEQDWLSWCIEINTTINGEKVFEYFDDVEEFLEFLEEHNITEEELYSLLLANA